MSEYHKINSIYKRDMSTKTKNLIIGDWSQPEFEYLQNNQWVFTEKVDGTNIRVIWQDGKLTFGGRTDNAQIPTKLFTRLQERFTPELMEKTFTSEAILYGEGYGSKIQTGHLYREDQDFVLFDVKIGKWWLERSSVTEVAMSLGIGSVPVIGRGTLHDAVERVTKGLKSQWGDFEAEGIVARPAIEMFTRSGQRIICKIKGKDFR